MARRTVVEVCNYWGPYPGTFIPTLIEVGGAVRDRLGLGYHCVFPEPMKDRPWTALLTDAGIGCSFLEDDLSAIAATRELGRIASRLHPAVVRSHFSRWDIQSGAAARRHGAATVWHMHSGRVPGASNSGTRARDLLKVRLLGRLLCDRVFAVSDEIARLAEARGALPARIDVVLNGIDVGRFDVLPDREAARSRFELAVATPVALAFAWSPRTKGADILIEAARPLGEAGRLQVVVVGPRSIELSPTTGVDWLRVVDPVDDVAALFAAADLFVSASRDEGFSYAIGEAMASRLPVISSDLPGPSGYFAAAGVSTFRTEDVVALRECLERMLADPARSVSGEANRAFVQERFGIAAHVDRVISLFSELVPG